MVAVVVFQIDFRSLLGDRAVKETEHTFNYTLLLPLDYSYK